MKEKRELSLWNRTEPEKLYIKENVSELTLWQICDSIIT